MFFQNFLKTCSIITNTVSAFLFTSLQRKMMNLNWRHLLKLCYYLTIFILNCLTEHNKKNLSRWLLSLELIIITSHFVQFYIFRYHLYALLRIWNYFIIWIASSNYYLNSIFNFNFIIILLLLIFIIPCFVNFQSSKNQSPWLISQTMSVVCNKRISCVLYYVKKQ